MEFLSHTIQAQSGDMGESDTPKIIRYRLASPPTRSPFRKSPFVFLQDIVCHCVLLIVENHHSNGLLQDHARLPKDTAARNRLMEHPDLKQFSYHECCCRKDTNPRPFIHSFTMRHGDAATVACKEASV